MIPQMAGAQQRDVVIEHPNRQKASVKVTKAIVVLLLLVSAVLMTIVMIGGWGTLEGQKPMLVGFIMVYVLLAFYAARWFRGTLPLAAALAILLLIFAAIAAPEWFARDRTGFLNPSIDESILGLLTALLIPVQVLLVAFAMRGFSQDWHVELERPAGATGPAAAAG